ncbi:ABC transporter ATP-binding protein [Clostridium estertheticum]|uniref:ABC transporter ATP-binding protein n=1 Tax=Clostridium estertheticum TaxID=238834 RepID=UPI00124EF47C|nr:ABC transporter ATP-binding protein [Clostridium estertheticum]MBU3171909.1 ABC transporter ATP-binding protein [Clostridium estertheticum]MBZ9618359.1 ABC transporter ATP-binding protein [Clostridium estertheticum subsp. laramiense]WAG76144.1 ABC transporter ATP-binding protein [Clostridium estertheticum]
MIEISHVFKQYNGNEFYSVSDISFNVKKHTICGLLGHNGAGKSTMMKLLATLYHPDKGKLKIGQYDTVKESIDIRKMLSIVFETPRLYDQLTGEENVLYFAKLSGISKNTAMARVKKFYSGLEVDFQNQRVETYSKGMKQKISFIRALVTDPQVILMDEPTSGLDIISRNTIREYTMKLKEEGKTVIITSHIVEDIEKLCDKVVILNKGSVNEDDTIHNLKKKYGVDDFEQVYISIQNNLQKKEI